MAAIASCVLPFLVASLFPVDRALAALDSQSKRPDEAIDDVNLRADHSTSAHQSAVAADELNKRRWPEIWSHTFEDASLTLLGYDLGSSSSRTSSRNRGGCPTGGATVPSCNSCSPYRTPDGTCNNLLQPLRGSVRTPLSRFARSAYADGVGEPRTTGVRGAPLPSARKVSTTVAGRRSRPSRQHTHLLMQWGQFIDHDLSLSPTIAGNAGMGLTCCAPGGGFEKQVPTAGQQPSAANGQGCFNIAVPNDDPYMKNRTCIGFSRSSTLPEFDCKLGQRSPINSLNSYMDASMVYGSSQAEQKGLRSLAGGRLRAQELNGRRSLLPPVNQRSICNNRNASNTCFLAGDVRVNQLPGLTSLHIVLLREHNRIADALARLNPKWNDEKLFQEARKIVVAELQHITYSEFLPIIVGPHLYERFNLRPQSGSNYYAGYTDALNAAIRTEFSTVAYRFGHSLIRSHFTLDDELPGRTTSFAPKDHYFSPDIIYNRHFTEGSVIRGLLKDAVEECDFHFTPQVAEHLFETGKLPNTPLDLVSLNVQRGRDHGIPSYASLRRTFGMTVPSTFGNLLDTHDNALVEALGKVYENVLDIDAFVGGVSERPLPGAVVGPLFGRIIATQFALVKRGDRFFYENDCQSSFPSPCAGACNFRRDQLTELRKASLSRLLCDNVNILTIQRNAFKRDTTSVPCGDLPKVDLAAWKDAY